ncbi:MobV family relaxase, partial [Xiamenia xianingshaonis]
MPHIVKHPYSAVGHLASHDFREPGDGVKRKNENIDPERTRLNGFRRWNSDVEEINAFEGTPKQRARQFLQKRVDDAREATAKKAGRKCRANTVVLCEWVVTLPPQIDRNDTKKAVEFFSRCFQFAAKRYGMENVPLCAEHFDETTPHCHIMVIPMVDGKLNAKKLINRRELSTFHGDLSAYLEANGLPGVSAQPKEDPLEEAER